MAAIILQDKWRRQPSGPVEIDRSNSFGALCAVAVTPQTIQGLRKSGFTLSGKEFLSAPRARDLAYYTDGASGYTAPWGRQVTGQALSFFGLISSQTTGAGLICAVSAGGGAGIGLAIWSNFAGTEYPALWHGSAGVFGSTAYQARNTPRFAVVTTNGSNSHNLYIDGRWVLSNTTAIGTFTSSWVVGVGVATSSVYSQVWQGAETSAALSGVINAELTASAVLDLSSNYWQIFRKQPRILYFTAPSGGGGATGTGALSAQSSAVAGTATRTVTGTGTPSAQASTVAGTAEREITSSGTPSAQSSTVSGSGSVSAGISGSGSLSAQSSTVSGTATRTVTASGAPAAQSAAVAGTAEREITGTGTPAAQASTVAGTGQVGNIITGSGTPAAQSATVAGTAERTVTGSGSPAAQASTVAGTGVRTITGSGAVAANDSTVYGYDTAPAPSGDTGGGGSRRVLIRERKVREEVDEWLAKKAEQDLLRKIQREDEEIVLIMALVA